VRKHTDRAFVRISIDHSAANKSYWGVSERICLAIEGCDCCVCVCACTPYTENALFSKKNNAKESRINPDSATVKIYEGLKNRRALDETFSSLFLIAFVRLKMFGKRVEISNLEIWLGDLNLKVKSHLSMSLQQS
jgi:hypothetical protein